MNLAPRKHQNWRCFLHTAEIHIIVAMTENRVIGYRGGLPWKLPEDLELFKQLTLGAAVIMGRTTFESIGGALAGRANLVVSRHDIAAEGIVSCRTFSEALVQAGSDNRSIFCIGGAEIYRAALPLADILHISWVEGDYEGDTLFPAFDPEDWQEINRMPFTGFTHVTYRRKKGQA